MEPKVIVLAGPTGSGKTYLSLKIAEQIPAEIISADSRQIYKHLDIGTAKPSGKQLEIVPHHLVDILEPDEEYNASMFEHDALDIIKNIIEKDKTAIVAGGSGLYIKALVDGIFSTADSDDDYREMLYEQRNKFGNEYLYNELQKIDPESASKMLPQNWKRIIRALEVFHLTGKTITTHHSEQLRNIPYSFIQFGLDWQREVLYSMIEKRVDGMIEAGLIDEVKNLLEKGYSRKLNALNTVGYKEIISFLDEEYTLDKAIELIKRNTRRYAKRQLTWFRGDERINWIKINSENDLNKAVDIITSTYKEKSN